MGEGSWNVEWGPAFIPLHLLGLLSLPGSNRAGDPPLLGVYHSVKVIPTFLIPMTGSCSSSLFPACASWYSLIFPSPLWDLPPGWADHLTAHTGGVSAILWCQQQAQAVPAARDLNGHMIWVAAFFLARAFCLVEMIRLFVCEAAVSQTSNWRGVLTLPAQTVAPCFQWHTTFCLCCSCRSHCSCLRPAMSEPLPWGRQWQQQLLAERNCFLA